MASEQVFSIPFRHLWDARNSGELTVDGERPTGLARFVGDEKNRVLRLFSQEKDDDSFIHRSNQFIWPLVLFGSPGTGKTSLALTIISDIAESFEKEAADFGGKHGGSHQPEKLIVLTSLDFDRRFRAALETDSIADFRRRLLRCSGLVIDDVHQLSKKLAAQNELLQVIDQMQERNRPIVLTMDQDPQQCRDLVPQLASRLCAGLSLPVNSPGDQARTVIIKDLCKIHHLQLTDEALNALVGRLNVTVPKIVAFFNQLVTNLRAQSDAGDPIPRPYVVDLDRLTSIFSHSDSDLEKFSKIIIKEVSKELHVKPSDLRSNSRKQSIVQARAVAIYLNRKLLGISFLKIGSMFGNRDHSTIMHAHRKIEIQLSDATKQSKSENPLQEPTTKIQTAITIKNKIEKLEQRLINQFSGSINIT